MITLLEEKGFVRQPLWELDPATGLIMRAQRVRTRWVDATSDRISNTSPTPEEISTRRHFVSVTLDPALPFHRLYILFSNVGFINMRMRANLVFQMKDEEVARFPTTYLTGDYPSTKADWLVGANRGTYTNTDVSDDSVNLFFSFSEGTQKDVALYPKLINQTADEAHIEIINLTNSTYGGTPDARWFLGVKSTNYLQ